MKDTNTEEFNRIADNLTKSGSTPDSFLKEDEDADKKMEHIKDVLEEK